MEQIVEGMRVRVTLEGVVTYVDMHGGFTFTTDAGYGRAVYGDELSNVEILAPPPREFEDGAYYLNEDAAAVYQYERRGDTFRPMGTSIVPRCPLIGRVRDQLVKLVPEVES